MRNVRTIVSAVLLGGCLASLSSGCTIRAQGSMRSSGMVEQEPPPPRAETYAPRQGYVFVRGRWDLQGGRWVWRAGSWQRQRVGHVWVDGHWERRGNRHHWIDGRWDAYGSAGGGAVIHDNRTPAPVEPERRNEDVVVRDHRTPAPAPGPAVRDHRTHDPVVRDYPTAPPPAARPENPGNRSGYVWIPGYYRWDAGTYTWIAGHWERKKAGRSYRAGGWEHRGDRYIWVEGRWE